MRMQFSSYILAIILLCICLPFGLCDKNNHQNDRRAAAHQNGKSRPKHGIPLRDDSDYIRENEENQRSFAAVATAADDDYSDEYYDGETNDSNVKSNKNNDNNSNSQSNDKDENDVQQSPEIVEQAQSARTQIIQRPKELTDAEINALLKASPTPNADATAPGSIEMCPKECSCLNDFMTCTRPHLKHLPKVPQYIQSLYVSFSSFFLTFFSRLFFNCFTALFYLFCCHIYSLFSHFLCRILFFVLFSSSFEFFSNQIRISCILCNTIVVLFDFF